MDRMAAADKSQSRIGIGNTRVKERACCKESFLNLFSCLQVPGLYDVEYDRKRSTKNLVQIREGPAMER